MIDREKVIKALEWCEENACIGCPYCTNETATDGCKISQDILELLKEQEPVEPTLRYDTEFVWYVCGACEANIISTDKYCHECGRPVKWE